MFLFFCQEKKQNASDNFSLWGTWVVQSIEIKDDNGTIPPANKMKMERDAKGQVWQFNSDSTVTMKKDIKSGPIGKMGFSIEKRDGHTLLAIGTSVTELMNMTGNKMDMSMSQGVTFIMHFVKQ